MRELGTQGTRGKGIRGIRGLRGWGTRRTRGTQGRLGLWGTCGLVVRRGRRLTWRSDRPAVGGVGGEAFKGGDDWVRGLEEGGGVGGGDGQAAHASGFGSGDPGDGIFDDDAA